MINSALCSTTMQQYMYILSIDEMNYYTYSLKTDKDRLSWPTVLAHRGKKKDNNLKPLWNAF